MNKNNRHGPGTFCTIDGSLFNGEYVDDQANVLLFNFSIFSGNWITNSFLWRHIYR